MAGRPNGFEFTQRGDEVRITHLGRPATTLRGAAAAQQFLDDVESGDPQELMARVTGNYKHGNECQAPTIRATADADRRPDPRGRLVTMARTVATAETVDLEALLEFVRPRHQMVLTTFRTDGSLQSSPVSGGVDQAGRIVIASYPERAKAHNIRRAGRASVVVLSDDFGGAYVQLDGPAEVIDLPEAIEPLVEYFRAIAGEHSDWDEYRAAMVEQGKCLLRVTPQRWSPVATGGFPARLA